MKYLWIIRTDAPFGSRDWKVITDNHNPSEAITVAKNSSFIKNIQGEERAILSVEFVDKVYSI